MDPNFQQFLIFYNFVQRYSHPAINWVSYVLPHLKIQFQDSNPRLTSVRDEVILKFFIDKFIARISALNIDYFHFEWAANKSIIQQIVTQIMHRDISENFSLNFCKIVESFCTYINFIKRLSAIIPDKPANIERISRFNASMDYLNCNQSYLGRGDPLYKLYFAIFKHYLIFKKVENYQFVTNNLDRDRMHKISHLVELKALPLNFMRLFEGDEFITFIKKYGSAALQDLPNERVKFFPYSYLDYDGWHLNYKLAVQCAKYKISPTHFPQLLLLEVDLDTIIGRILAFHVAAQNGHLGIVNAISARLTPEQINAQNNDGWAALHWAVNKGHEAVVSAILARLTPEQINTQNNEGVTALHWAANNGHEAVVRAISARLTSEQINIQNNRGWTALHLAAQNGHLAVVRAISDMLIPVEQIDTSDSHRALQAASPANRNTVNNSVATAAVAAVAANSNAAPVINPNLRHLVLDDEKSPDRSNIAR